MRYFLLIFFLFSAFQIQAQIERGGHPVPLKKSAGEIPVYTLPGLDTEDALIRSLEEEDAVQGKKPFRFAHKFPVKLNPENSGIWTRQGGMKIWRLEIYSPNAYALSAFFDSYRLNQGTFLFIFDPAQESILGGFNHLNNKPSGKLPVGFVPGERLIIELQVPEDENYGELSVGWISHSFIDIFNLKDGRFGLSGDCNIDINCSIADDWQELKRAVCRIFVSESSEYCTGTLINNTGVDQRPYLFTANHCIKTKAQAESAIFYFGYESLECNGGDGSVDYSLAVADVIATSDSLDFSLLELSEAVPDDYMPYYAGWSLSKEPTANSVCIHHPQGDVKKIAIDYNSLLTSYQTISPPSWLYNGSVPGAFWRVAQWDVGTTEGGSSGSPLFNPAKLIIGNLTGGDANCVSSVNDYFSKFYMCWNYYPEDSRRLKPWLDPENTNLMFLDGFDPFDTIPDPGLTELFTLYPNPNQGQFMIYTDTTNLKDSRIRIFNMAGSLLGEMIPQEDTRAVFNLEHLPAGLYIIEIKFKNATIRKKFVITK